MHQLIKSEQAMTRHSQVSVNDEQNFQAQWAQQNCEDLKVPLGAQQSLVLKSMAAQRSMAAQEAASAAQLASAANGNLHPRGIIGMDSMVDRLQAARSNILQQLLCSVQAYES